MKIYKAKRKKVIEGREKPYWIDTAFTIIIGEWQGRETISLVDERTGERYYCFESRPRDGGDRAPMDHIDQHIDQGAEEDVPF